VLLCVLWLVAAFLFEVLQTGIAGWKLSFTLFDIA
jgi:hypothetical protein